MTSHLRRWPAVLMVGAALLAALGAGPAAARERIALVIGNGTYRDLGGLANATNDAALIAATLRDLDFEVAVSTDLDQNAMKRAIKAFGKRLDEAGQNAVGLFYYAGHGIQVNGSNFLIPIGAGIVRESDVDIEAVDLDWVLTQMEFAANGLNFLIIDACRNNPVTRSFRTATRGLAQVAAPRGTLIAYATEPGGVAADGDGDNSPYTLALAKNLQQPGQAAEEVFRQVRVDVLKATGEQQVPWETSSLTGAFYFSGSGTATAGDTVAAVTGSDGAVGGTAATGDTVATVTEEVGDKADTVAALDAAASPPADDTEPDNPQASHKKPELALWQRIEDKDDPALLDLYLRQYPDGAFSDLAARRRDQLGRKSRLPTAVAAIEILPQHATLYIQERANIRGRPSADAELITTIDAGRPVRITGEVADHDWYQIALADHRQAFIWKPLVGAQPPLSASPDATTIDVAAVAAHSPAPGLPAKKPLTGLWRGQYRCQNDRVSFSVDITEQQGHQLSAVFRFYPTAGSRSGARGSYAMTGEASPDNRQIQLQGTDWINRPVGFQQHDLEGRLDTHRSTINGQILTVGCADFILSRGDRRQ